MGKLTARILELAVRSGEGHMPSSLSILDIIRSVYAVKTPDDVFLLSKGHGCLALYVVLEELGLIPSKALDEFCQPGAVLLGHPERNLEFGITATTGSLGHGLPMAVGMALAKRIKGEPGRVFVLCGDGELEEGASLEAILVAGRLSLKNLVLIVDNNRSSPNRIDGERGAGLLSKMTAFDWDCLWLDGHDEKELRQYIEWSDNASMPLALIANTKKGHGIPEMEADPQAWHHRKVTAEDVARWVGMGRKT